MSINIQLDGKLQKISGQTMTKDKIVEKLGYTPANEATVNANIAELNSNLDVLEDALEDHKNSMSDIDAGCADDEFVIADPSGNVIAKFDDEGLHTTSIEAESFMSNDKELAVYDDNGNAAFKIDENGITHAAKLELNSGDVDDQLAALSADIAEHASKTVEHVTSTDRARWDNKSDFSGNYSDLVNAPNIVEDESGEVAYTDAAGNIIFKIDADGAHTTKLELTSGDVDTQLGGLDAKITGVGADLAAHETKVIHITSEEREAWNAKSEFSGDFNDLTNSPFNEDSSGEVNYADESGNIIFKINDGGAHTTEITLLGGKVDERLNQLSADIAAHRVKLSGAVDDPVHITPAEREIWNNKSDVKSYNDLPDAPSISPEDNEDSLVITDSSGHIVLKAGELAEDTTGLETTTVIAKTVEAQTATIGNVYNKTEVDAHITEHKNATKAHTKAQIGLSNVDNTADLDKPISTETQTALDNLKEELSESVTSHSDSWVIADEAGNMVLKAGMLDDETIGLETTTIRAKTANIDNVYTKTEVDAKDTAHATATSAHTKSQVGLGNVDNTSDIDKPVSTATQAALNGLKTELSESITSQSDSWTIVDESGNIVLEAGMLDNEKTGLETTYIKAQEAAIDNIYTKTEVDANLTEHVNATSAHSKAQVGLGNVDNTSDADKPVSTATQVAMDALKEEIVTESDSWTIVDGSGNIMLKAGQLGGSTIGLETTAIFAETANINNIYDRSAVDAKLAALDAAKSDKGHDHDDRYYTEEEVDNKIAVAVTSALKYKGTKNTTNDLPASGNTVGDVWNIAVACEASESLPKVNAGDNVAWNGESWDVLAGTIDLSSYYTKPEVNAAVAAVSAEVDAHKTEVQTALEELETDLKAELSEEIVSESKEWQIVDTDGNILLSAGELDDGFIGLETTGIKATNVTAETATIGNIYTKTEVDAKVSEASYTIKANASDDNVVILAGTDGENAVSYSVSHAKTNKAGTYTKVTVNDYGHITDGSNPTTIEGYGITNAYTKSEVDAEVAEHANAANAHTKAQVGLGNVDNTSDADKPVSNAQQAALNSLKSELSESIVSEAEEWTLVDNSGNVVLRAGELDGAAGLETTAIVADTLDAKTATIGNVYTKAEVEALIASTKIVAVWG